MQKKKQFFAQVGLIGAITMLSRILGVGREMAKAHLLGTSLYSDAFSLAFSLPNLFRRLTAEGAMSNAFIPVFCEIKEQEGKERALEFARNFFWILSLILSVLVAIFLYFTGPLIQFIFAAGFSGETLDSTILLSRVMFGYILFISLAATFQGVLNSFHTFWVSSITPVFLNLAIIGCAFLLQPYFSNPAVPFALGVLFGGIIQAVFQLPYTRRVGLHLFSKVNLFDPRIKESLKLLLPTLFGAGIYQINIIISNLIATTLGEGALSSLTFSNRLLELVLGVFVISITTVILPNLAGLFAKKDYSEISHSLTSNLSLVAFVTLTATAFTLVLAEEIVALLFLRGEFDTNSLLMTAGALKYHILGLFFIGANRLLLTAYQASKQIRITVWVALATMIINLGLAFFFAQSIGHYGIALASSISQACQWALLFLFLSRLQLQGMISRGLLLGLGRHLLLAGSFYFLLLKSKDWILSFQLGNFSNFTLLCLMAIPCFAVCASILRPPEIKSILRIVARKLNRNKEA